MAPRSARRPARRPWAAVCRPGRLYGQTANRTAVRSPRCLRAVDMGLRGQTITRPWTTGRHVLATWWRGWTRGLRAWVERGWPARRIPQDVAIRGHYKPQHLVVLGVDWPRRIALSWTSRAPLPGVPDRPFRTAREVRNRSRRSSERRDREMVDRTTRGSARAATRDERNDAWTSQSRQAPNPANRVMRRRGRWPERQPHRSRS